VALAYANADGDFIDVHPASAMELTWLEDFIALGEIENFSRAAEARNVTQPAFSRRIRALEGWVGTALFDRKTHRVQLTTAGRQFLPVARETLRHLYQARDAAREVGRNETSMLRFAATHVLSSNFFPEWLGSLDENATISTISLRSDSMQSCETVLLQGEAHFLVCHYHPAAPNRLDPAQFLSLLIGHDTLVLAAAPKALATIDDIEILPYLAYSAESGIGRIVANTRAAPAQYPVFTSHLAAVLRTMASHGRGVAWLPLSLIRDDLDKARLIICPETSRIDIEIRLYRPKVRQSANAEAFWSMARSWHAKLSDKTE
jgi:DNA-binding transcriptional LysR family regulator